METTATPSAVPSSSELDKLKQALESQYPDAKNVLGAQLGWFIRSQLSNPRDLKTRFGGLKNFVARHFPEEISWRGRQGLDDLYDISFSSNKQESTKGSRPWKPVPPEASSWLWSAVTNPSINVEFAWSAETRSLMHAPPGVLLEEGLVALSKLSRADYKEIASAFVRSVKGIDAGRYLKTIESSGSSVEFTALVREQGLLSRWEEFRVDKALRLFADRMQAGGANGDEAIRWIDLLRVSRQEVRSSRTHKTATASPALKSLKLVNQQTEQRQAPQIRAVALKAMAFLTDAELAELRLPLGSVMQAVRSLFNVS